MKTLTLELEERAASPGSANNLLQGMGKRFPRLASVSLPVIGGECPATSGAAHHLPPNSLCSRPESPSFWL